MEFIYWIHRLKKQEHWVRELFFSSIDFSVFQTRWRFHWRTLFRSGIHNGMFRLRWRIINLRHCGFGLWLRILVGGKISTSAIEENTMRIGPPHQPFRPCTSYIKEPEKQYTLVMLGGYILWYESHCNFILIFLTAFIAIIFLRNTKPNSHFPLIIHHIHLSTRWALISL